MGSRTDWLTEVSKPVADRMAKRCGSLKKVLSAGVLALDSLSPELREVFMAKASGEENNETQISLDQDAELYNKNEAILMPSKKAFRREVLKILQEVGIKASSDITTKKVRKSAKPSKTG